MVAGDILDSAIALVKENNVIDLSKIKVELTEDQAKNIAKFYDHHIREVLPVLAAMLGVDINVVEGYQEYIEKPSIWDIED